MPISVRYVLMEIFRVYFCWLDQKNKVPTKIERVLCVISKVSNLLTSIMQNLGFPSPILRFVFMLLFYHVMIWPIIIEKHELQRKFHNV